MFSAPRPAIAEKAVRSVAKFDIHIRTFIPHVSRKLIPGHVRSDHQVESRDLTSKSLNSYHNHSFHWNIFKFSEVNGRLAPKLYTYVGFSISVSWVPSHQWMHIEIFPFSEFKHQSRIIIWGPDIVAHSWHFVREFGLVTCLRAIWGHSRQRSFLPLTSDWEEPETWICIHCVCLVETNWFICNMTYLDHRANLNWGQTLTLTFQGHHVNVSMFLTREHVDMKIITVS